MSYYRMVHSSFWTDTKVSENFTPEDRYFYMYLLTNPHANLAGCYELGMRKIVFDTGYSEETVRKLLDRMEKVHDVIRYSWDTNEILILNFKKYNWTRSPKYQKNLVSQIEAVKNPVFRDYLEKSNEAFMSGSEVSIPVQTGIDTCPDGYRYDSNLIYSNDTPDITDSSLSNLETMDNNKEIPSVNCNTNGVNCNTKDYEDVVKLYNSICTDLPKVRDITEARKKVIKARLKKYDISTLSKVFETAQNVDFLKHGSGTWPGANFDWLMNENNLVKVLEGNYRNGNNSKNKGSSILDNPSMNEWEAEMIKTRGELYGSNSELAQLFGTGEIANDYQ